MIAYITGRIVYKGSDSIIIENNGIGYEIYVPVSTLCNLPTENQNVNLFIYPHIKDETLTLFGFLTMIEKKVFLLLTSVAGIGPKLAMNVLSGIGIQDLLNAVVEEDIGRLSKIPGVGVKTAKRIILELKEKFKLLLMTEGIKKDTSLLRDAISALVNLGYPLDKAEKVVKEASMQLNDPSLEALIKESLRIMANKL